MVTEYERCGGEERLKTTFCFLFEKLWGWNFVLLVNLGGRSFCCTFFDTMFEMPAEEPGGVTRQAGGNVGLDFSKEDRFGSYLHRGD